jgi:hypothetical protein
MLRQSTTVVGCMFPVAIGDLGDDFAPFLDCFQHGSDIKMPGQCLLYSDFNVVKVDKDCDFQTIFTQVKFLTVWSCTIPAVFRLPQADDFKNNRLL